MITKVNITKFAFLIFWLAILGFNSPTLAQYQGCLRITQIPTEECEALERFFEQTNGRFWQNNRGWLVSNQPCNWFGLTCTSSSWPRNVVSIKFSVNDISGSLPGELSQLSELRELIIENSQAGVDGEFTQLEGSIPAVLGDLKKLEILWLSHNKIGLSLANEIGGMSSLRILRLNNNLLTGPVPSEIGDLPQLEEIDLSHNLFAGAIPPELSQLSRLHTLILAENLMSGSIAPSLGNLGSLRKLDLANNAFTGALPASLTSLKRLNSLMLQGNDFDGIVNYFQAIELAALPECELAEEGNSALCLPGYDIVQDTICGLEKDSTCSACSGVNDVTAEECIALEATYKSTKGSNWNIANSWFDGSGTCSWEGVSCENGRITRLSLANKNLSGSIPADISLLSDLQFLDLSMNNLSGPIPTELGRLSTLDDIDLSDNDLSGVLPLSIAELASQASRCEMGNNDTHLCIPINPDYQIFGSSLCGIEASLTCEPEIFTAIEEFDVQQDRTRLVLTWQVDEFSPGLSFRVQQLQQGDFANIGVVDASEGRAEYQFIITQPISGVSTFRIQMISRSGTLKNGPEVETLFVPNSVLLRGPFPNPGSEQANFSFALEEDSFVEIDLVDVNGRIEKSLLEEEVDAGVLKSLSFNLTGLNPGIYFIHVKTNRDNLVRSLQVLR